MPKLVPMYDRILVKRSKEPEKSKGGIFIPDNAKEKPAEGEVLAVGPGRVLEDGSLRPLTVTPGQMVLFGKYSGTPVNGDDDTILLREDDLLGYYE